MSILHTNERKSDLQNLKRTFDKLYFPNQTIYKTYKLEMNQNEVMFTPLLNKKIFLIRNIFRNEISAVKCFPPEILPFSENAL